MQKPTAPNTTSSTRPNGRNNVVLNRLGIAALTGLAFVGGAVALNPAGAGTTQDAAVAATDNVAFLQDATEAEATADADSTDDDNRRGRRGHRRANKAEKRAIITETLGVTAEDLREARQNGESLADVAVANGVAVEDLVDALVEHKLEKIEERADTRPEGFEPPTEDEIRERITAKVNGERPERGNRGPAVDGDDADAEGQNFAPRFRGGQGFGRA